MPRRHNFGVKVQNWFISLNIAYSSHEHRKEKLKVLFFEHGKVYLHCNLCTSDGTLNGAPCQEYNNPLGTQKNLSLDFDEE